MINIETTGRATKARKQLVAELVEFGIRRLMPRIRNLDIVVRLRNIKDAHDGLCVKEDEREYEIQVNCYQSGMDEEYLKEIILHEMVHVKQFVRKEMNDEGTAWKGKLVETKNYMSLPWEIEAYALEGLLVKEFNASRG